LTMCSECCVCVCSALVLSPRSRFVCLRSICKSRMLVSRSSVFLPARNRLQFWANGSAICSTFAAAALFVSIGSGWRRNEGSGTHAGRIEAFCAERIAGLPLIAERRYRARICPIFHFVLPSLYRFRGFSRKAGHHSPQRRQAWMSFLLRSCVPPHWSRRHS